MKQNYYEILEVDKNASPEIIKKAYNTLAKKYHPDLQNDDVKHLYEEKLKLINEAYETLSDNAKRAEYDKILISELDTLKEKIDTLSKENELLKSQHQNNYQTQKNSYYREATNITSQNNYNEEQIRQAKQQAYHDAYIQDLKNRGYKIKYKKEPKDYFKNFIAFLLTTFILLFLWQLPFVRNFILENKIVQTVISIFKIGRAHV